MAASGSVKAGDGSREKAKGAIRTYGEELGFPGRAVKGGTSQAVNAMHAYL